MLSARPARWYAACAAVVALLAATLVMVPGAVPAFAVCPDGEGGSTTGGGIEVCDDDDGQEQTDPDEDQDGGGGGSTEPRVCTVPAQGDGLPEFEIDCVTEDGVWNDGRQCYEQLADPQPPKSDPEWDGHDDGYVVTCTPSEEWCNEVAIPSGTGGRACLQPVTGWQPNLPGAEPVDPEELAREAFASLPIEPIDIGIVPEDEPGRIGLVGLPVWMWAQDPTPAQMGPQDASASDQGLTVTLEARVDRVVWDMGDGTTVTCQGPGTPYADVYDKRESPDCGHRYTRQGEYEVTATTYWVAEWTGGDDSGEITADWSTSTNITIGEAQVLVQ